MAERVRNSKWEKDTKLKGEMRKYVSQGLRREEILDFLKRDFPEYALGFRTLERRLRAFDIYFIDKNISVEQVQDAVRKELDGPGKLLGYREMQNKLRQKHGLNVLRDLFHDVMYDPIRGRPCNKMSSTKTKEVSFYYKRSKLGVLS